MTEEVFKAGIREVIDQALLVDIDLSANIRLGGDGTLTIEGEINTEAVAEAVHAYIVNKLQPPF